MCYIKGQSTKGIKMKEHKQPEPGKWGCALIQFSRDGEEQKKH